MDIKFSCGHIGLVRPGAKYDEKDLCPYCKQKEIEKEEERELEEYYKRNKETKEESVKFSDLTWEELLKYC